MQSFSEQVFKPLSRFNLKDDPQSYFRNVYKKCLSKYTLEKNRQGEM